MIDLIDKEHFISFLDFVIVDNDIYFSNDTFNALVQVDIETKKVVHMEPFLGAPLNKAHMHTGCIRYGNQIFFYSMFEQRINVFDLESRGQTVLTMEGMQGGYFVADICEEEIYFLPENLNDGIIRYSATSQSLQRVSWYQNMMGGACRYSNMAQNVWIAYEVETNQCLIIDLNKKSVQDFITKHKIFRLDYSGGNVWYVSRKKGCVYCYSIATETEIEYLYKNWEYMSSVGTQYVDIFVAENYVFLISGDIEHIFVVDQKKALRREIATLPEDTIDRFVPFRAIVRKKQMDDVLIISFQQRKVFVQINLATMNAEVIHLDFMDDKKVKDYLARYNYDNGVIMSEDLVSLDRFIDICIGEKED